MTEAIGLTAALYPHAWLSLFSGDAVMLDVGSQYLRIVGPFYGFFGMGLALYFASQGAGRMGWPLAASALRVIVAAGGGLLAVHLTTGVSGLFLALAVSLVVFGGVNAAAVAGGAWVRRRRQRLCPAL